MLYPVVTMKWVIRYDNAYLHQYCTENNITLTADYSNIVNFFYSSMHPSFRCPKIDLKTYCYM